MVHCKGVLGAENWVQHGVECFEIAQLCILGSHTVLSQLSIMHAVTTAPTQLRSVVMF